MKKVLIAAFILLGSLSIKTASAQLNISINIGSQPAWAPVGYDHVDYYYLPDINAYYSVPDAQFIYLNGNRWRRAKKLPSRYGNYNIYNSYKVVVNRSNPYNNNRQDIARYGKYKGQRSQPVIRDSREEKYYQNRGNVHHDQWQKSQKNDNKKNDHKDNGRQNRGH